MGSEAKKVIEGVSAGQGPRPTERPRCSWCGGRDRDQARGGRPAHRLRLHHHGRPLPAGGRVRTRTCSPGWRRPTPTTPSTSAHLRLHLQALADASTPAAIQRHADRGLPISCFLNAVGDSLESIVGTWNENVFLAANGGGIGTYWGGVRSIGEKVKGAGQTSGIIPFIIRMDSLTPRSARCLPRRGFAAVYIDVWHPEIEEFVEIRNPGRLQPQEPSTCTTASASPTSSWRRCATASRSACVSEDRRGGARGRRADAAAEAAGAAPADRRALPDLSDTANRAMPQHQRELG